MIKSVKLSKTEYLMYLDAPRHLWAYSNNKLDSVQVDTFTKHLFEQGYDVQNYAREFVKRSLIPKEYGDTSKFLFEYKQVDEEFEARIDLAILNPNTNKWDIYEIKSTNEVKPIHKKDLTFQYLVFRKHLDIGNCYILHLNNEYVREGELSIPELFIRTDITEDVQTLADAVHEERYEALSIISNPNLDEIPACIKPKTCPIKDLCHPNLPEYSIYEIARLTGNKDKIRHLETNYSKSIFDVPNDATLGKYSLTENQRKQVDVAQRDKVTIDVENITNELNKLVYPLYFIDYESFNPAIPMYDKYKPFDQMPFQYSLHIQESPNSEYIHKEFIETNPIDPSLTFLESLKNDIGENGSIIIWSKFERTQNEAMKRRYSQYESLLENMNSRLWDLMEIFQKLMYIHPKFKGSYSIKKVLPILASDLSYKDLAIGDGSMAMTKWVQMVYGGGITALDFSETEDYYSDPKDIPRAQVNKEETKNDLLKYCEVDTWAMVKILEQVKKDIEVEGDILNAPNNSQFIGLEV